MTVSRSQAGAKLHANLGDLNSQPINIDLKSLSDVIWSYLKDVAALHIVTPTDLNVWENPKGETPKTVSDAIANGTKFFDAIYFVALGTPNTVICKKYDSVKNRVILTVSQVQHNLLLLYLYIMLRGGYPLSTGKELKKDIPTFMVNTVGMTVTPHEVATSLASFKIQNIPIGWIKMIPIEEFAPEIKQRFALGFPGYRLMAPFKNYELKSGVTAEVTKAYAWVRRLSIAPPDWAIIPPTRSATISAMLGPLNKNLGNLILECFTDAQIAEMIDPKVKILFEKPTRDPRADNWKTWADLGPLALVDPVFKEIIT
jgi:hypothetical protein